ncbi:MAG: response regulator transcription factor [Chitinophagaceae bacterium]|nr:response regulator transcription factor [Chitinophagaceae bacterium]
MKALVIDNEPHLCTALTTLLKEYCPEITAVESADGVQSGLQKIRSFQPDIVLLDVEMDDGTGFDLMKQVSEPPFQLIFVTAHNKYAIEAFRFSAIDFLLKPVDPDALQQSIARAQKNIRSGNLQQQVQVLLSQMAGLHNLEKKIVLKDLENTYFIRVADILFCEAEGTYTKFFIKNSNVIIVSKNLKEYEAILEPIGFIRTHHSFLVNPAHIKLYDRTDGGALILDNGQSIPVSQRKKDAVLQALEAR